MWQRDGWDARARIGVLIPHVDVGPEAELAAMAPDGVTIHATRVHLNLKMPGASADPGIALSGVRSFAEGPEVDVATELLSAAPLDALIYGFFSSSYVIGYEGDRGLKTRLESKSADLPVTIPGLAAIEALHTLGIRKLALVDPPWFSSELSAMGADYFRSQGIEVVYAAPAKGLPIRQIDQQPSLLLRWIKSQLPTTAEAVLTGGNGFRAVGAIEVLEQDLGCVVLTANQVSLWSALRASGVRAPITRYGRLFSETTHRS